MLKWTTQDSITFLIGLGTALAFVLGEAMIDSQALADDPAKWAIGLGTGLVAAAGRYIVSELARRGFGPKEG